MLLIPEALAQSLFKWPWEILDPPAPPPPPPKQLEPEWLPPPQQEQDAPQAPLSSRKSSICFQLEQRLVEESQVGNKTKELIPLIESQLRQVEQQYRLTYSTLENANCYEYFLFAKTLRKTKKCLDLSREVENLGLRKNDLENQRSQLTGSSGQSYQDEIIRELARNNCGSIYTQQAARQQRKDPFSFIWEEEGGPNDGRLGKSFSNLPFATYRTLCVRLCDGYYFPISFSTLPNHFDRDEYTCQSKCVAPTELYYYQNPGESVDQMVGARTNVPYTQLQTAFRYRNEYVQGCSCKVEEYDPLALEAKNSGGEPGSPVPKKEGTVSSGNWSSETTPVP